MENALPVIPESGRKSDRDIRLQGGRGVISVRGRGVTRVSGKGS